MLKSFVLAVAVASASPAFEGVVLADHTGEALISARVRVRAPDGAVVADRDTDRSGRFSTPPLAPGAYRVEASKPGYLPAQVEITLPSQAVNIRLAKLGVISGRVVDANQQPVPSAFVFPMVRASERWSALPAVETDAAGEYRLHGLAPGTYRAAMSRAGSQQSRDSIADASFYPGRGDPEELEIAGGEEHENIDFTVFGGPAGRVMGHVAGAAKGNAFRVVLARRDEPSLGVALTTTDDLGGFHLSGIPAGSYVLFASGPIRGYGGRELLLHDAALYSRVELETTGQNINEVAMEPAPPLTEVLKVEPAPGCPMDVSIRLEPLEFWAARTGHTFQMPVGERRTVEALAPGPYQAIAEELPPGCFQDGETVLDPRDDSESVMRLSAAARIVGRLLGATSPTGYRIALAAEGAQRTAVLQVVIPDAEGRFGFEGLQPGSYRIVASPANDASMRWMRPGKDSFVIEAIGASATEIEIPARPLKRTQ